jgi:hypothetical protein
MKSVLAAAAVIVGAIALGVAWTALTIDLGVDVWTYAHWSLAREIAVTASLAVWWLIGDAVIFWLFDAVVDG